MTYQLHFKEFDLARLKMIEINKIKVSYHVESHLTRSDENGLILTLELDEINLQEHLSLIESFGLETY